uniref:Adenylosuccinate synthetase n=1 Tax=Macrostomum lignano TaxID=282301 RepID=A0A1I8J9H5_9PLAT
MSATAQPAAAAAVNGSVSRAGKAQLTFVMGSQWGDEGKGKLVDWLAAKESVKIVCRCQGGNNAGHTVIVDGVTYDFHLLPSGVVHPGVLGVIGHGVVIHVPDLFGEIGKAAAKGLGDIEQRLLISDRAHLVFNFHQIVDGLQEGGVAGGAGNRLGTTRKGIGPTYSSKMQRNGIRVCDLMGDWAAFEVKYKTLLKYTADRYAERLRDAHAADAELSTLKQLRERLRPMVKDTVLYLNKQMMNPNCHILVEGAQSSMLDIDVGTYPYVTSSNCSVGGLCTGLGVPPHLVTSVYGVVKAYTTRGIGREFGVTTGRKRRCGWLDAPIVKYSHMVNGFKGLALTKLDVLDTFDQVKIGVAYKLDGKPIEGVPALAEDLARVEVEFVTLPGWKCSIEHCRQFSDLPPAARAYVEAVELHTGVPVLWIGVGPSRDCIVVRA